MYPKELLWSFRLVIIFVSFPSRGETSVYPIMISTLKVIPNIEDLYI